jgi:hypothetical protein
MEWSGVEWSGGFLNALNEMAGKGEPVMVMMEEMVVKRGAGDGRW